MMERRKVDRDMGERVVSLEIKIMNIELMLSRIEKDLHEMSSNMDHYDKEMMKRIAALEAENLRIDGGKKAIRWVLWIIGGAVTIIAAMSGFLSDIIKFIKS
jgi:hypothetical protein